MTRPDEIKKGLACYGGECPSEDMACADCPMNTEYCDTRDIMQDALAYIHHLEQQNAEQAAELEKVKRERDALKADILRANDKAKEMQEVLDYDVHPNCDYGLYCDLCDALSDIIAWEVEHE